MAQAIINAGSFTGTSGSVTISAGSRRKLVFAIPRENTNALSGVTVNGNAATSALAHVHNINTFLRTDWFFYDITEGAGSYTLAIGSGGNPDTTVHWWQTADSASGALENAAATNVANSTTTAGSVVFDVTANALILAVAITGSVAPTWAFSNAVSTRVSDGAETAYTSGSGDGLQGSSGSKTVTATASTTAGDKIVSAVSIAEDTGTPPGPAPAAINTYRRLCGLT